MKYIFSSILLLLLVFSCDSKKKESTALPADPCLRIDQTLIGTFQSPLMEGSMIFSGGVKGTVDISGNDFNDITCTYTVEDCTGSTISMLCEGSAYNAEFEIYSRDSIRIDAVRYGRIQ